MPIAIEVSKLISKWVFYIEQGAMNAHFGLVVYVPLLELGSDNGTQHTAGCRLRHACPFFILFIFQCLFHTAWFFIQWLELLCNTSHRFCKIVISVDFICQRVIWSLRTALSLPTPPLKPHAELPVSPPQWHAPRCLSCPSHR